MNSFSGELEKELSVSDDWQSVLRHFSFHQGFALAMILVHNDRLAEACRRDVERELGVSGRTLVDRSPTTPEELVEVCLALARGQVSRDVGAIWISAVVSEHAGDYAAWYEGFKTAFARLNPLRNRMQQDVETTVTFVCAPWTKVLLRTMAPDLWSIRSLVTEIAVAEPSPSTREVRELGLGKIPEEFAPDPEFALARAERLRGAAGQELTLASLLERAGAGFQSQGRYGEALAARQEALEMRTRIQGEDNPDTLTAMNNLAETLQSHGDYDGARRLLERFLEVETRVLGEDHPDTFTSMNNLAGTLWCQGDYAGARRLEEQVLAARTRVLGEDHPDTLTSMINLVWTLSAMGEKAAALGLLRKGVAGLRKVLGEQHPHTMAVAAFLRQLESELGGN